MAIKKLPSTGDAPRATGVPETLVPGGAADSAGYPWAGRSFDHHETAFADDSGETPEAYGTAVAAVRAAATALRESQSGRDQAKLAVAQQRLGETHAEVLQVLSTIRVLVPMLAEAGDLGLSPEGRVVDKTQELSIVTVGAPDGRRVLPVFTSVDTMRKWNPEARPIPVPGPQAAVAAAQDITDLIIVDAATAELEFGVRRTALEAMALGEKKLPAWADDTVIAAFQASIADSPEVRAVSLVPGDPEGRLLAAETDVYVGLEGGLERERLMAVLGELQQRWAADERIAQGVDSLRIVPREHTKPETV